MNVEGDDFVKNATLCTNECQHFQLHLDLISPSKALADLEEERGSLWSNFFLFVKFPGNSMLSAPPFAFCTYATTTR